MFLYNIVDSFLFRVKNRLASQKGEPILFQSNESGGLMNSSRFTPGVITAGIDRNLARIEGAHSLSPLFSVDDPRLPGANGPHLERFNLQRGMWTGVENGARHESLAASALKAHFDQGEIVSRPINSS
jgi:hypothetical protein